MSTTELRELADLDALGLLDEVDTHRFEQALMDATVVDQEMVRNRQAMLLQRLVGAPAQEMPEGLRDRVLAAVREDIAKQDDDLAPIATIGRRRRDRSPGIGTYSGTSDLATSVNFSPLEITRLRRASTVWRAASFGLAAGLLVAIILSFATREQAIQVDQRMASKYWFEEFAQTLHAAGKPTNLDILKRDSTDFFGVQTTPGAGVALICAINTDVTNNRTPFVTMIGLGAGNNDRFLLEVQADDGTWSSVGSFAFLDGSGLVDLPGITAKTSLQCANANLRILRIEDGGDPVVVARRIV